jgi:hypothetical protein
LLLDQHNVRLGDGLADVATFLVAAEPAADLFAQPQLFHHAL